MREPITLPRNPSKSFIAANPQLYGTKKEIPARGKMPRSFEAIAEGSPFEEKFFRMWEAVYDDSGFRAPEWTREFRFAAPRKWRFDAALPERRVAVELEGGVFSGGRHTRGSGFVADCSKYNEAALRGWVVFRIPTGGLEESLLKRIAEFVRTR